MKISRHILSAALAGSIALVFSLSCSKIDELSRRMDDIEDRVAKLETLCRQLNESASALRMAVDALEGKDFVTGVAEIKDGATVIGYEISFSKSGDARIYNGQDGSSPALSLTLGSDGLYYWTVDGELLRDRDGKPVPASAVDGKTPQFSIVDGWWYVSYDGIDWSLKLGRATGEKGDSFFGGVDVVDDRLVVTLADGRTFSLAIGATLAIAFDSPEGLVIAPGGTVTVGYTISSSTGEADIDVLPTSGVKAKVEPDGLGGVITIVLLEDVDFEYDKVSVIVTNGAATLLKKFSFETGRIVVTDELAKTLDFTGGEFTIEFASNLECEVSISELGEQTGWIQPGGQTLTRSMTGYLLSFSVARNDGNARRATITVSGDRTSEKIVYTVVQYGEMTSLKLTHNLALFSSPEFSGGEVEGLIDWGDGGALQEWSDGAQKTYSDGQDAHTVDFRTRNASGFTLGSLSGIRDINIKDF